MYSLLVTASEGEWETSKAMLDESRFLEHTESALLERFKNLDQGAVAALTCLPTVFAYEKEVGQSARVGWITSIRERQNRIRIKFEFDPEIAPFTTEDMIEHAWEFDINNFEMNRTHWAVKDVDLLAALDEAGLGKAEAGASLQQTRFTRGTIIGAAKLLKKISHADFDLMLLEFGIAGLDAGRGLGGRLARSNALAEFAIENPSSPTAEGETIGYAIVQRAVEAGLFDTENDLDDIEDRDKAAFGKALEKDGFTVSKGRLTPATAASGQRPPYTREGGVKSVSDDQLMTSTSSIHSGSMLNSVTHKSITITPTEFHVPEGGIQTDLVAVMMPFDGQLDATHDAIKAACREASLRCKRVDDMWEDSTVIQDIFSLIYQSRIVVVDFSGRNSNVFYETGIAHTLGKPVVPITQSAEHVPFDLRHHRYLRYLNNEEGLRDLSSKLVSRLRTLTQD